MNMKPARKSLTKILITALVVLFVIGLSPATKLLYSKDQSTYKIIKDNLTVFNHLTRIISELYFESVDWDNLFSGAFKGMMDELDPHSVYIPPKEQEELAELFHGKFQGIGIEFDILNGYITVITPVADSPSERVGLQSGDQIVAINGEDAFEITREEVFKKLRGPKGTSVDLTIHRLGLEENFDVTIIRDDIPIYSVRAATMLDETTGYIALVRFAGKPVDAG